MCNKRGVLWEQALFLTAKDDFFQKKISIQFFLKATWKASLQIPHRKNSQTSLIK